MKLSVILEAKKSIKKPSQQKLLVDPSPAMIKQYRKVLGGRDAKGQTDDKDVLEEITFRVKDFMRQLAKSKKDHLPLTYKGDSGYAYTIVDVNPLRVAASDSAGETLPVNQTKYFTNIGEWADQFWEDVINMDFEWAIEHFVNKQYDQSQHELNQLRGD